MGERADFASEMDVARRDGRGMDRVHPASLQFRSKEPSFVTTSKALVTTSVAPVSNSFLLLLVRHLLLAMHLLLIALYEVLEGRPLKPTTGWRGQKHDG